MEEPALSSFHRRVAARAQSFNSIDLFKHKAQQRWNYSSNCCSSTQFQLGSVFFSFSFLFKGYRTQFFGGSLTRVPQLIFVPKNWACPVLGGVAAFLCFCWYSRSASSSGLNRIARLGSPLLILPIIKRKFYLPHGLRSAWRQPLLLCLVQSQFQRITLVPPHIVMCCAWNKKGQK